MTANLKALVQKWLNNADSYGTLLGMTPLQASLLRECAADLRREIERMESEPLERARKAETPETGALKPCPFCGCRFPEVIKVKNSWIVGCNECMASVSDCAGVDGRSGKSYAIKSWNRRTP